ncbi:MAG: DNA polymerase ligase N-terminal domain-containing protein [Gemmatales bacterium]|nr:hypothetical protein [Gemmatales bacterium]MDW7993969.1 DNA polymerase ligase N-terminal domain-containing protein [Gemmatales bacterium]
MLRHQEEHQPKRFVLLHHDWPHPHYDLMLEWQGVLKTWRTAEIPKPGLSLTMEAIGDHRLAYLDYEGPVAGNRGTVRAIDRGTYYGDLGDLSKPILIDFRGDLVQGRYELRLIQAPWWQLNFLAKE